MKSQRILFISHEIPDDVTRRTLETRGFTLTHSEDVVGARQQLFESEFNSVVILLGDDSDGITFIRQLRETESTKKIPVVALGEWGTGQPSLALSQGADAYEKIPVDGERLATSIERVLIERAIAAGITE